MIRIHQVSWNEKDDGDDDDDDDDDDDSNFIRENQEP